VADPFCVVRKPVDDKCDPEFFLHERLRRPVDCSHGSYPGKRPVLRLELRSVRRETTSAAWQWTLLLRRARRRSTSGLRSSGSCDPSFLARGYPRNRAACSRAVPANAVALGREVFRLPRLFTSANGRGTSRRVLGTAEKGARFGSCTSGPRTASRGNAPRSS